MNPHALQPASSAHRVRTLWANRSLSGVGSPTAERYDPGFRILWNG